MHACEGLVATPQSRFTFTRPDGPPVPSAHPLPATATAWPTPHETDITTDTIVADRTRPTNSTSTSPSRPASGRRPASTPNRPASGKNGAWT